jgi:diguanylate cyclase (GGDEF)-like protein/PAS domain S-box-containing protein
MFRSKARQAAGGKGLRFTGEGARAALDSIGDAVLCIDLAGTVTYLNPVAERMTGWSVMEAYGRSLLEVLPIIDAESREPVPNPLAMAIASDAPCALGVNSLLVHRDGHETAIEDTAAPIHDEEGRVTGAVIVFHDVGAALALSLRMSQLAQHDVLTGLPNRLLLNDRLDRAIATARRHDRMLAVLFMDLDGFKSVNDNFGHSAGDQLLQSIARRLTAGVRGSDTVCRQGGDEFVVLLSEVTCAAGAAFSAGNLLAAIAAPHRIGDRDLHVTASVGIGVYPSDGTDAETLIHQADLALLRSRERQLARPSRALPAVSASRETPRITKAGMIRA